MSAVPRPAGPSRRLALLGLLAVLAGGIAALQLPIFRAYAVPLAIFTLLLGALVAVVYLVWNGEPALILTVALCLSVFAGSWQAMGIPGALGPERWLFVGAVAAVLLRAPALRDRPVLRLRGVHWLMVITLLYIGGSALASGTLTDGDSLLQILQVVGLLPYALFLVAPLAFRSARARDYLLGGLVVLGAYLGLTALFETVGATQLIFPAFIVDPSLGIHFGRARGPFLEAVTNGMALYTCAVGCAIALFTWQKASARASAGVVLPLCLVGLVFTLQRSVWVAAIAATLVAMLVARPLRRYLIPVVLIGGTVVALTLLAVPDFQERAEERRDQSETIYERRNLNRAATNMVLDRPLLGHGWQTFLIAGRDYFEQAPDYPMGGYGVVVHNVFLSYAAETGLIGLSLWVLTLAAGLVVAWRARAGPALQPWRVGLVAIVAFFALIANFVFPLAFPNVVVWLWAGVVAAGDYWDGRVA